MSKPEPIRVGVEGIAPKPIELTPDRPRIDWAHLFGLPPFQMYAIERAQVCRRRDGLDAGMGAQARERTGAVRRLLPVARREGLLAE